jgi:hypothetical protein
VVGFLDWRVWDRLDQLDRRTGLRRPWTKASIRRTERAMWLLTTLVLLSGLIDAIEGRWVPAVLFLGAGILGVFTNRWWSRKYREYKGSE